MKITLRTALPAVIAIGCAVLSAGTAVADAHKNSVLRIEYKGGVWSGGAVTLYCAKDAVKVVTKSGYVGIARAPDWDAVVFNSQGKLYCVVPQKQWQNDGIFIDTARTNNIHGTVKDEAVTYKGMACRHIQYLGSANDMFLQVRGRSLPTTDDYYVTNALPCGSMPMRFFCDWSGLAYLKALPVYESQTDSTKRKTVGLDAISWHTTTADQDLFSRPSGYTKVARTTQLINEQAGSTIKEIFGDEPEAPKKLPAK